MGWWLTQIFWFWVCLTSLSLHALLVGVMVEESDWFKGWKRRRAERKVEQEKCIAEADRQLKEYQAQMERIFLGDDGE